MATQGRKTVINFVSLLLRALSALLPAPPDARVTGARGQVRGLASTEKRGGPRGWGKLLFLNRHPQAPDPTSRWAHQDSHGPAWAPTSR